uniref:Kunitz/Bovine pancreatic trypsin inhibitor domain protein n=1 Tax=Elaeophora elaphi TaxID=1147741 RepID=A0A0R3RUH9_9BILA
MDTTYALLLIVFFRASNKAGTPVSGSIVKLVATLSNTKSQHPCQQPVQRGNCSQRIPLFYYSNREHKCRKFMYSGCDGNENRFLNRQQCHAKCGRRLKFRVKQSSSTVCNQRLDPQYRVPCRQTTSSAPAWVIRYFYDANERRCRRFWYGGSCFSKFDENLRYGCKTFDWRPRFFYNQTSSKCEMFWYDASCSKRRKLTNIFYHRGACKRLCEKSEQTNPKPSRETGARHIGQISVMFSQPYGSIRSNGRRKLLRMKNIFDANSTPTNDLSPIRVVEKYVDEASADDNASIFDFQILRAEFRRSIQKVYRRGVKKDEWNFLISTFAETSKCDEFDSKLAGKCRNTEWTPRYYYDMTSDQCRIFWSSGCTSDSGNNFDNITSCQERCTVRWLNSDADKDKGEDMLSSVLITRCLEPLALGNCSEMHPAYYYNREVQRCEPFIYSGCNGNSNRFRTLRQCQKTCHQFRGLSPLETNCFLPLDGGERFEEKLCAEKAGIRYYYNQKNERCERFWYSGCAGNENRFYDLSTCETVCQHIPTRIVTEKVSYPKICFEPITSGKCVRRSRRSVQRWAYDHVKLEFQISDGLAISERCMAYPEWDSCNQLSYQWFYNLSKGTCEQFLWGGCNDGNENRFDTFEKCQQTCEIPVKNECFEPLDRGLWCQSMSNRYYYHSHTNTCRGFHYTGCGKSRNIFETLQECEAKCMNQTNLSFSMSSSAISSSEHVNYRGVKPPEKQISRAHQILVADDASYIKTDTQWLEYGKCIGFRYNITGEKTRLTSSLCSMESGGTCRTQSLSTTKGDEKCRLMQPWLKGMHLYSWFFTIDRQSYPIDKQALNETIASLIILPPNDCHSIC